MSYEPSPPSSRAQYSHLKKWGLGLQTYQILIPYPINVFTFKVITIYIYIVSPCILYLIVILFIILFMFLFILAIMHARNLFILVSFRTFSFVTCHELIWIRSMWSQKVYWVWVMVYEPNPPSSGPNDCISRNKDWVFRPNRDSESLFMKI